MAAVPITVAITVTVALNVALADRCGLVVTADRRSRRVSIGWLETVNAVADRAQDLLVNKLAGLGAQQRMQGDAPDLAAGGRI